MASWFTEHFGRLPGLFLGASAGPWPGAEEIKSALESVIAQGPYDVDRSWRVAPSFQWLRSFIEWISDIFSPVLGGASYTVTVLLFVVLTAILFALLAHILWSFYAGIRVREVVAYRLEEIPQADPKQLEAEAEELAAAGNYVDASRALYLAALVMLEAEREGHIMVALTNSEYLDTFKTPWVIENLRTFVSLINWKWYRDRTFNERDYQRCKTAYDTLRVGLEQRNECSTPAA